MVKRIKCRVVHSVSLTGRSGCAESEPDGSAEPSAGDPNIAKILRLIYNIKCKMHNRYAPTHPFTYSTPHRPDGLVIDFVA